MSRWYRAYEGTVTDAKLAEAALIADCSRSVAIAGWHCLLESAAGRNNCGSFDATPRRVAAILCEPLKAIEQLFSAFEELGLIGNGAVASWKRRQYESDSSTERSRKHRETKRNGHATLQQQDETPPDTDTDSEVLSSNDDSPSVDEPALRPEHIQEFWNEFAPRLGRPTIRDLTPERRQLVRARIAQYSIDDFKAVFGKCEASPFLRGDKGRTPLTFDWIMKKGNFQKTLEGNYDR